MTPDQSPLPPPWIREFDSTYSQVFYVNPSTNPPIRQWNHPSFPLDDMISEQEMQMNPPPPAYDEASRAGAGSTQLQQRYHTQQHQYQEQVQTQSPGTGHSHDPSIRSAGGGVVAKLVAKIFGRTNQIQSSNGGMLADLFGNGSSRIWHDAHGMRSPLFLADGQLGNAQCDQHDEGASNRRRKHHQKHNEDSHVERRRSRSRSRSRERRHCGEHRHGKERRREKHGDRQQKQRHGRPGRCCHH